MSASRHQQPGLNFWTHKVYCSYAAYTERLMTDNQPESAIEQRSPSVPKNRRKFLRSHLCLRIMIMCTNYDHAYPTYKLYSLSMKRAHWYEILSPIKFDYISNFVLICCIPLPHPLPHSRPHFSPSFSPSFLPSFSYWRDTLFVQPCKWHGSGWGNTLSTNDTIDQATLWRGTLYEWHYAADID